MTIRTKIILGFGMITLLLLAIGVYLSLEIEDAKTQTEKLVTRNLDVLKQLKEISLKQEECHALRNKALAFYLLGEAGRKPAQEIKLSEDYRLIQEQWKRTAERTQALMAEIQSEAAEFERTAVTQSFKTLMGKILQKAKEAGDMFRELMSAVELHFKQTSSGDLGQVAAGLQNLQQLNTTFDGKMEAMSQLVDESVKARQDNIHDIQEGMKLTLIIVIAVALLVSATASIIIIRSITRPLGTFMQFVERVGQGDLTQQASATSTDELGKLGQNLNQMVTGLKDVAGQTRSATENLNSAAAEILAATQQQAAGMQEQAGAVQETTSTMEEINQSGTEISEKAKQVAATAEATSTTSAAGLQAVQSTTRMMEALREQSEAVAENIVTLSEKTQAIGDIIATVTDIAEQSNLLALNAAIEAAAAGEHGRSFTVVANEIKNLADQAKTCTVQVRTILGEIQKGINTSVMLTEEAVKRVDSGKQQADVTEQTIRQMSTNIQQSVQAFQQIVAAQNQQQIGFEQVTQALKNIRQTTEQTVSSTRQLEKAAANLNALGHQLSKSVERYRV